MHIDKYERYWLIAVSITLAVFMAALFAGAIIFGVSVPEAGGFINPQPEELMNSEFANPGLRDMGDNHYEVYMLARMWSFSPNHIEVPKGATVDFIVTSFDVTHGFIIQNHNVNFEIVPGHIARARVTFGREGRFYFLCHEYCGQQHQNMSGYIDVIDETAQEES